MPVARAFREAKEAQPHGEDGVAKETGGLVKNVSTRWNSNLAMFRYTGSDFISYLFIFSGIYLIVLCC